MLGSKTVSFWIGKWTETLWPNRATQTTRAARDLVFCSEKEAGGSRGQRQHRRVCL